MISHLIRFVKFFHFSDISITITIVILIFKRYFFEAGVVQIPTVPALLSLHCFMALLQFPPLKTDNIPLFPIPCSDDDIFSHTDKFHLTVLPRAVPGLR